MASGKDSGRGGRGPRSTPMGANADHVSRAARGRTDVETTPVHIRGAVGADGTLDRAFIHKRLGEKLGKYARRIDRLDVAPGHDAPAKGAKAKQITIEASVANGAPIAVTGSGDTAHAAFLDAIRAIERSTRRWIERRRRTTARAQVKRP